MYEGDAQSVLRCGQCNKPFDKESTLKRHGYYCRSIRAGSNTRPRSCFSCARYKARCDNRHPECSRCISRAIGCHYPAQTLKSIGLRDQHSDNVPTERQNTVSSLPAGPYNVENGQDVSIQGDHIPNTSLGLSESEIAVFEGDYSYPDTNLADFLILQTNDKTAQDPLSEWSPLVRHMTPSTNQTMQIQQAASFSDASIPMLPTYTPRSFVQRTTVKSEAQRTASLIFHILKAYPLMLQDDSLPPFIHPSLVSSDVENDEMEPLSNCISLVHMLSSRVRGSRKLFWRNVRTECEQLCAEHPKLDEWALLAAMQALSIYILIRMDEGETDHNNIDALLITTVIVTASQFSRNAQSAQYSYSLDSSWKHWVLKESARRLCVVYQVVNMLVYFEPAALCDMHSNLILAPLPAKKQLWEAGEGLVWKVASEKDPGLQTAFGMAANGDLIRIDEDQLCYGDFVPPSESLDIRAPSRSTTDWGEWCSGMDGMGGLVMLAASLVS